MAKISVRKRLIISVCVVLCGAMHMALTGCALLWRSVVPAASDPEAYVFSARKEVTDQDYSFQITGNIYEQGTLVYSSTGQTINLRQNEENQRGFVTSGNRVIQITGTLTSLGKENLGGIMKSPGMKFISSGSSKLIAATQRHFYTWNGVVHSDGSENARVDFTVYAATFNGNSKLMAVDKAGTSNAALEFEYVILKGDRVIIRPPIQVAKLISGDSEYGLYAVTATDYRAKYPDFDESELDRAVWSSRTRVDDFGAFLLKPGQKFQIVDGPGAVFAEIFGDAYTLYDACAGMSMSQRKALKESIALFYVFRLLARRYFSRYTAVDGYAYF